MRTYFELDEAAEFASARDLLVRRCAAWAAERRLPADEVVLAAALESRHLDVDGRLAYWGPDQVRRTLLEWIPGQVPAGPDTLGDVPGSLRTLLRFLADCGLRDPRGADPATLEAAIAEAAVEYPAVLKDPLRWGLAKFWALTARDNGVDLGDPRAAARFQRDIQAGRVRYDAELLDRLTVASLGTPGPGERRAFAQPPVTLPAARELTAAADTAVIRRLTALTEWVGTAGRPLTTTGNLRLRDARRLAVLLGTGEEDLEVRRADRLPQVTLLLTWARRARLVRVSKGRLVRVAKAAPLLRDARKLWRRAFEVLFELGDAVFPPARAGDRPPLLAPRFGAVLSEVLDTSYGMPCPVPVARFQETVWLACQEEPGLAGAPADRLAAWREQTDADLVRMLELLAEFGAVELSHGVADELFRADLDDSADGGLPLSPEARARLADRLTRPGLLVRLTPLGTWAMRERLLAAGREAPLVGELAGAAPAELLGTLAQHYTPEAARTELDGWLAAHGGDVEPLLEAVRRCPFRSRAALLLGVLVEVAGDLVDLHGLRADPALGPLAVRALLARGELRPADLSAREETLRLAEELLTTLELGGPDAVWQQLTGLAMAGKDATEVIRDVLASGHPATQTLAEFRALVPAPAAPRPTLRMPADRGGRGRPTGQGKRRRR